MGLFIFREQISVVTLGAQGCAHLASLKEEPYARTTARSLVQTDASSQFIAIVPHPATLDARERRAPHGRMVPGTLDLVKARPIEVSDS